MGKRRLQSLRYFLFYSVIVVMVFSFTATASATNGYFAHGYSIKNKALAGANTALPLDSLAASSNPAGMVFLGKRADIGISFFNPVREYKVKGAASYLTPGTYESGSDWFIIPALGANWMLDEKSSVGLSVYGNGGMNTDYNTTTYPGGSSPTGVDLAQMFIVPSYALKVSKEHAFGIGLIGAYQRFEVRGLQGFRTLSQDSSNTSNNGHDNSFGYGARVGYLGEVLPGLFFGASYQSRVYMQEFDKYAGLFAEEGDFDIPSNWSLGLAYNATPELTFVADIQHINYSEVNSVGDPFNPAFNTCYGAVLSAISPSTVPQCLGGKKGIGFGWEDMTIYKLGIQWQSSPSWTWRAGYSIGDQPIPDSEVLFNIIAPGVIEQHATAGFTTKIDETQELNFALMYAFSKAIEGANPIGPGQTIELKMHQWEISAGYAWKF